MKLKTLITKDTLMENTYVITENNNALIIDPGCESEKIKEYLDQENINKVTIFITHAHHDHITSVPFLVLNYNALVYINEKDYDMYKDELGKKCTQTDLEKILNNTKFVDDALTFLDHTFKVYDVPGHTLGHIMIEIKPLNALFTGDFLFRDDIGYTVDANLMKESLNTLDKLNKELKIYPGHGMGSTLEYELINNYYINNPIESW